MTRRLIAAALALSFTAAASIASAQYPDRPVKIIVPFSAGGFTDSLARIVGQKLQEKWGQPVVIENKPGAGGNIGAELAAKSPPDGYTLLIACTPTHGVNPALYRKLSFDPVKDFEPIVLMVATPNVLILHPAVPVKSVSELISTAKANPKLYNYGSTGIGSSVHLQMEQFKSNVGIQMTHIPYKGSSQALTDLMAGSVQVMFDNFLFQLPHIKGGKVKPIAITAMKRSPLIPDVPTLQELGIAGFEMGPWFGLAAPAKTPAAIVSKISADVNEVLKMKDVQEKLQGAEILGGTPRQFADFIGQELDKWGKLIAALDLKAD
jgi:tripartite-type tricarboxylate transporter receptor subunit TctC